VQGNIDLRNLHDPGFDVGVSLKKFPLVARQDIAADADLDLDLQGTYGATLVGGTAQLQDVKLPEKPDTVAMISSTGSLNLSPVLPFDASQPPFNKWQYAVEIDTPQPVKAQWLQDNSLTPESAPKFEPSGTLSVTGALRGKGEAVWFSGDAVFQNVATSSPHAQLSVNEGTLIFPVDDSPVWLSLAVSGKAAGENLTGWVFGPENAKASWFFSDPPLSQDEILNLITTGDSSQPRPIASLEAGGDVSLQLTDFSPSEPFAGSEAK
jgi:hypothetical protein